MIAGALVVVACAVLAGVSFEHVRHMTARTRHWIRAGYSLECAGAAGVLLARLSGRFEDLAYALLLAGVVILALFDRRRVGPRGDAGA